MTWVKRVLVKTHRRIRPWFFEQDGGWYVQCRYGARVIAADGTNNAVFVKSLADVLRFLMRSSMQQLLGSWMQPLPRVAERQACTQTRCCQSCSKCLT